MAKKTRCKATVQATGKRCTKAASDDWGLVCAWHKNQWIAIEMGNVSNLSRNTSWKRPSPTTFPDRTPLRGMSGNVETSSSATLPADLSRRGDQSRHGSTAEPCRAWKGSPSARTLES